MMIAEDAILLPAGYVPSGTCEEIDCGKKCQKKNALTSPTRDFLQVGIHFLSPTNGCFQFLHMFLSQLV